MPSNTRPQGTHHPSQEVESNAIALTLSFRHKGLRQSSNFAESAPSNGVQKRKKDSALLPFRREYPYHLGRSDPLRFVNSDAIAGNRIVQKIPHHASGVDLQTRSVGSVK